MIKDSLMLKSTQFSIASVTKRFTTEQVFMLTMLFVNGGNYLYNLILGRVLGPKAFADAAILITFLLILSFIGMTFQIVTTKYVVVYNLRKRIAFIQLMTKSALISGAVLGILVIVFSNLLQKIFHTQTAMMFVLFGAGMPLYFLMSVKRGIYQGKNNLNNLSKTYALEMISRLLITVIAIISIPNFSSTVIVASGITLSFVFGVLPFLKNKIKKPIFKNIEPISNQKIATFFALTAFYEFTQIIINNSDVMLVKYYFNNYDAGLYASLALIGRVVYFVAWMFVMLLLPKVLLLQKEGKNTRPVVIKYVGYIVILSSLIISITYFFPKQVVFLMFGEAYLSIAFLLWKYALATSIFAIANIFAYYFLSINKYFPVVVSGVLGFTQIFMIILFHKSLEVVIEMQIIAMLILLIFQLIYFFYHNKKNVRLN